MADTDLFPTPQLPWPPVGDDKWQREFAAFQKLRPTLLQTHRDQYVAIHEGQVVSCGDNKIKVAKRAYAQLGYVPVYVGLVTDEPQPIKRIASPKRFPPVFDQ